MLVSSRIAVCGQPPVSTPMTRSAGSASFLTRNSASSRVKTAVGPPAEGASAPHPREERREDQVFPRPEGAAVPEAKGTVLFRGKMAAPDPSSKLKTREWL